MYGQWLMLASVPAFLAACDLGFGQAAGNRLIGEVAQGHQSAARSTFQSAFAVVLASSASILALALCVAALVPARLLTVSGGMDGGSARMVLVVMCIYGVIAMQSILFMAVQRAHGAYALSVGYDTTVQLAEGLAVVGIALAGGTPLSAACAYLSIRSAGVAGHVLLARHLATWLSPGFRHATRARMTEMLRPALAAVMMPLAQAAYLQGTALAVGAAAGAASVPIFTSLRILSRAGLQMIYAFNLPILPEFTGEHARGNGPWLAKVTAAMTTFNALIGCAAALFLLTAGDALLRWWTRGAITAPYAMIALTSAALLAGAVWNPLASYLLAVNRHERLTYVFIGTSSIFLILNYMLVRIWGITGASVANLLLDLSMLVVALLQVRSVTGPFRVGPTALATLFRLRQR